MIRVKIISGRIKTISLALIIGIVFVYNSTIYGQTSTQNKVKVDGDIIYREEPISGVKISILDGNTEVKSVLTDQKGKFAFELEYNKVYTLVFSQKGMVTKKISVNTTMPEGTTGVWPFGLPASVFPECPGIDNSVFNEALEVTFDKNKKEFNYNEQQYNRLKTKMDQFILQNENCLDEKFDEIIAKADLAMKNKDYEQAKQLYQEASQSRPDEYYPKSQLTKIDQEVAKQGASEDLYNRTIAEADRLLANKEYAAASTMYQRASTLKPGEQYPKTKVQEINQINATQSQALTQQQTTENTYKTYITQADQAFAAKNFELAKQLYTNALTTKPADAYAQGKINEAQQQLTLQTQKTAEEKARAEEYNQLIAQGDALMQQKKYAEAKALYQKALVISPAAQLPMAKITEIDKTVQQETKNQQIQQTQQKEQNFQNYVAQGDNYFKIKDYSQAKTAYQNALIIKPTDEYVKSRVNTIDNIIAQTSREALDKQNAYNAAIAEGDRLMTTKQYDLAKASYSKALTIKAGELYPQQKITEIDQLVIQQNQLAKQREIDQNYQNAIIAADTYLASKQYDLAKASYNKAITLKPNELYPQQKIAEIDQALASNAKAQQQLLQYNAAITEGNTYMQNKQYDLAKASYNKALTIKPGEVLPQQKIAEIDRLVAEQVLVAKQKEIDLNYQKTVTEADGLLNSRQFELAKASYTKALTIKPTELYPQQKITEIDQVLLNNARAKEQQTLYDNAMREGDAYMQTKQYDLAKASYNKALTVKPNEVVPKQKIAEADRLAGVEIQAAKQRELDVNYQKFITEGDSYLQQRNYASAKISYNQALALKPLETYPKSKVTEIDNLLAQESAARQREANYKAVIARADGLLASKDYANAKIEYNNALQYKPADAYAQAKINEINTTLAAQQNALQQAQSREQNYKNAIANADLMFNGAKYAEAKLSYTQALSYKPGDAYAAAQIRKADEFLAAIQKQELEKQAIDKSYNDAIAQGDALLNQKNYQGSKQAFQNALAIKPLETYPQQKIKQIDQFLKNVSSTTTTTTVATTTTGSKVATDINLEVLQFENESARLKYLENLLKNYPAGVTLEVYTGAKTTINRYIIIRNGQANEFREARHSWGGIDYTVNDKPITNQYFQQQVKVREGEYFNKIQK